jgi:hypothetical protein
MYARNGLVEVQATDLSELQRVSEEGRHRPPGAGFGGFFDGRFSPANNKGVLPGQEIHERVLERTLGAFGHLGGALYQTPMMMHCCTGNCCQGLYYAWEGIVRPEGEGAAVNLWLNRRSPWADVWSWLPHAGRLLVQNKGRRRISVRQPGWARRADLRCWIDGRPVAPEWRGSRMVFDGLGGSERIAIEAPCRLETGRYTLVNIADPAGSRERYAVELRGHTAVRVELVEPAAGADGPSWYGHGERNWYRIFRRQDLRAERPPMVPAPAYVHPETLVRWGVG